MNISLFVGVEIFISDLADEVRVYACGHDAVPEDRFCRTCGSAFGTEQEEDHSGRFERSYTFRDKARTRVKEGELAEHMTKVRVQGFGVEAVVRPDHSFGVPAEKLRTPRARYLLGEDLGVHFSDNLVSDLPSHNVGGIVAAAARLMPVQELFPGRGILVYLLPRKATRTALDTSGSEQRETFSEGTSQDAV